MRNLVDRSRVFGVYAFAQAHLDVPEGPVEVRFSRTEVHEPGPRAPSRFVSTIRSYAFWTTFRQRSGGARRPFTIVRSTLGGVVFANGTRGLVFPRPRDQPLQCSPQRQS